MEILFAGDIPAMKEEIQKKKCEHTLLQKGKRYQNS
jgi:hypothetical protein